MMNKKFFKTKDEVEVTFALNANGAEKVALVSEVNGWKPVAMKKSKGLFKVKVRFPKNGTFHFRYLVDGATWANDEAADGYVPNGFGSDNSIVNTYE